MKKILGLLLLALMITSLAACDFGGDQVASANEVGDAVISQAKQEVAEFFIAHNAKIIEHLDSLSAVKLGIVENDLASASGAWHDIPQDDQRILWVAPSKGGIFTTKEREIIKSCEFRKAHYGEPE